MANSISDFWKLLEEIQGEDADLTDAVKSIAKNEKTVSERLFTNVIDQIAYNSRDYERIRSFLRDWYAAHRSLTTYQANISDVYQMPNDQLDDLFQSLGYDYSTGIRDPISNNPSLNKINFFLDLVNLYKIKGSPQALVDVLQYYGLIDVDLYEMSLQYDDRPGNTNDIIFKGKVVSGTTGDTSPIYLPFDLLTQEDPHWLQTEDQIRSLVTTNKINFPSQSPYFTVKPQFDEEATDAATGILQRKVQDQYDDWEAAGFPAEDTNPILPQDAIITITGDQCSLLTIYLACIYFFNKEYEVGAPSTRFVCYDGTNTVAADIIDEFRTITSRPSDRDDQEAKYNEYITTFSRPILQNFLQDHDDAGLVLGVLNPTVKANLDGLATDTNSVLGTLLKDLGEWVRANISYGFINISYILFGIDSLFGQLRDVIEFFKPYRARIIPLELMQLRNRLLNSIVVEDRMYFDTDLTFHDFLVGDSTACCIDATCTNLYGPREYYDCGSYHDIGAVTDIPKEIQITFDDVYRDYLRCPSMDTTGYVVSEFLTEIHDLPQQVAIANGASSVSVLYDVVHTSPNYSLVLNIYNETDSVPSIIPYVITARDVNGFTVDFSDSFDSGNYYLAWDIVDATSASGVTPIPDSTNEVSVTFSQPMAHVNYTVGLTMENLVDGTDVQHFLFTITEKSTTGFTVKFSDVMPNGNYSIGWSTFEYARSTPLGLDYGWELLTPGSDSITVDFGSAPEIFDNYTLSLDIVNTDGTAVSNYGYIIISKTVSEFVVRFTSPIDTDGSYYLSWAMPVYANAEWVDYAYRQTGQMRNFDAEGTFDCTHGMDQVDITLENEFSFLLQENGSYLTQESYPGSGSSFGYRIRL
jgi:methionine-rich copper-binding protein CopC